MKKKGFALFLFVFGFLLVLRVRFEFKYWNLNEVHLQHLFGGIRVPLPLDNAEISVPLTIIPTLWASVKKPIN